MFDFHLHSRVSFDSTAEPQAMVQAAVDTGLKEICFTDHIDYEVGPVKRGMVFDTVVYNAAYDHLSAAGLKIRRGLEFGLKPHNQEDLRRDLHRRHFDFVIGSMHMVDEQDLYYPQYWQERTMGEAYGQYLEATLTCVRAHNDFDVLGHLTYASKCPSNPAKEPILYGEWKEMADEILKILVKKGKGLELNTSGIDRCGVFLPDVDYMRRFKELGGEIVTIGSDAHSPDRVGQYAGAACGVLKEIFGYVCTFEGRKPIFHKL